MCVRNNRAQRLYEIVRLTYILYTLRQNCLSNWSSFNRSYTIKYNEWTTVLQQRRCLMVILMTCMRYTSITACPPPLFNADDDKYFLILLRTFRQYLNSRRKPSIVYNFSIRTRILDNADADKFVVNDVYAVVIQRPYEFYILTQESTTSFQDIVNN